MAWKQVLLTPRRGRWQRHPPPWRFGPKPPRLATVGDPRPDPRAGDRPVTVDLGMTVCVQDALTRRLHLYTLVAPHEGETAGPRLSVLSPWGRALLGTRVGDTVELVGSRSPRRFRVLAVLRPAAGPPSPAAGDPIRPHVLSSR